MLRVRLVAAAIVVMSVALAGCSSASAPTWMPTWMPSWMTVAPPTLALQFESAPPGADVRAPQGQTCKTPCALALPLTNQTVSFALNGYVSQTVPVEVRDSTAFAPNPVEVTLQAVPKPAKPKPPRKAAATAAPPPAPKSARAPAPAQDSAFPPPPMPPSAFPPPPPQPAR